MKNTQKGFTLVELLVVIAILAILAGVGVAGYSAFIGRAEESNATTEAHQIGSAIETALIGNDYVIVTTTVVEGEGEEEDTTTYIYAYKDDNGKIVFADELPEDIGARKSDLSVDLASFASKLSIEDGDLHYAYSSEITMDVIAGTKVVED